MSHKRIYVRVPISGEATLKGKTAAPVIKAKAIDISQGGLAITDFTDQLVDTEYHVEVTTEDGKHIKFLATLVRNEGDTAGFRTVEIDDPSLQKITNLVEEFQATPDFINQIAEFDLMQQSFIDDDGTELEVTFDADP